MAQTAGDLTADLREIDRTRAAMGRKLDLLEGRLQDTLEGARASVADVVDRAQTAAEDVIDRIEDFVDRTRLAFNPLHQLERHPWAMVAGAVALGYALAHLESRVSRSNGTQDAGRRGDLVEAGESGPTARVTPRVTPDVWNSLTDRLQDEADALKGAAMAAADSFLHDLVHAIIPALLGPLQRERRRREGRVESDLTGSGG